MHRWIHCYIFFLFLHRCSGIQQPQCLHSYPRYVYSLHVLLFIGVYASNARKLWHKRACSYPQTSPTTRVCSPLNSSQLRTHSLQGVG